MTEKYPITELTKEDYQQAMDLACICFGENMRKAAKADLATSFTDYPYRPKTFIAKDGKKIIGFIQSLPAHISSNTQSFAWIGVHPDYRRQHLGRALLAYAEEETISNRFQNNPGTFLLWASYKPDYYRSQGYYGGDIATPDGHPFLVKQYRPVTR